jgi:hypothetical protein
VGRPICRKNRGVVHDALRQTSALESVSQPPDRRGITSLATMADQHSSVTALDRGRRWSQTGARRPQVNLQ